MPVQTHTIKNSAIDLQFNGRVDGFALQNEVKDWCYHDLLSLFDEVLRSFDHIEEHIRLDHLGIEVELDANDDWKAKLTERVARQLKEKLDGLHKPNDHIASNENLNFSKRSAAQNFVELLLFYLERGYLPWWSTVKSKEELIDHWWQWTRSMNNENGNQAIKAALKKQVVRLRVVQHLPEDLLMAFIVKLQPGLSNLLPLLWKDLEQITTTFSVEARKKMTTAFKVRLLQHLDLDTAQIMQEITKGFTDHSSLIDDFNDPAITGDPAFYNNQMEQFISTSKAESGELLSNEPVPGISEHDAIFITNAGLVIITPFLPVLFKRLEIAEEGRIIQPSVAVCLLYYILTGREGAAEFEYVLPKIFCGIDINEVVDTNIELTSRQKTEADDLLISVIEHWGILKNTSIDGLREAFLQREGKLSFHNNEWLLQVAQKPYDMLLQQLPWNISILKLSWMKNILKTQWI